MSRKKRVDTIETADPMEEIQRFLSNEGTIPPLNWVIEHSIGGHDPVTAVWDASAQVYRMSVVLDLLREDEVELRRVMVAVLELGRFVWVQHTQRVIDALLEGTLEQLPKSMTRASKEFLTAIERAETMIHPGFLPEGRRDVLSWSMSDVAAAIGLATEGIAHAPAAHHAVAAAIRSQVTPPTLPELIARIERAR